MDKEEMQLTMLGVGGALCLASCGLLVPLVAIAMVVWWLSGKGREDPPKDNGAGSGDLWHL